MVMGLVALVLGIGLGSIARIDFGKHASVGLVQNTLRAANNWAVSRRSPARVRIDAAQGVLMAEGQDVIGTWHFEQEPPKGAFELDGALIGAELVEDGFLGKAVSFNGRPPGARYEVPVEKNPSFDLRGGFRLQFALRPDAQSAGTVLKIGDAVGVEVTRGLGLVAWFSAWREDELGNSVAAGKVRLESPEGVLRLGRWNRVLVSYDRSSLVIEVEGLRLAELPEEAEVGPVRTRLELGGGQRPWAGALDSLVVTAVSTEEEVRLPKTVSFTPDAPKEIVFAPGGGLDRSVHSQPVTIELLYLDGGGAKVQVNLYGTVE